jgi:23S rRNA (uracil1939-C5)-methyltransferase
VQLHYKEQQVRDSLERLGGLSGFELRPIKGMPDPWRYRNKVEFSIAAVDGQLSVGFHPPGRWDTVLPLTECHLVPPETEAIRTTVESWLRDVNAVPWDARALTGFARHLTVREAAVTGEILVSLVTSPGDLPEPAEFVRRLREAHPRVVGILHAVNSGTAEVASGVPHTTQWGRSYLYEEIDGLRLKIGIDAFFQTNTRMAEVLYATAAEAAGLRPGNGKSGDSAGAGGGGAGSGPPPVLWDLYSGIGSIALYMARWAQAVLGIEIVGPAVADARENAELNDIQTATFLQGDARVVLKEVLEGQRSLPDGLGRPDVVVLDPPRGGLAKKVVARVAAAGPARVVYVSCNPSTMAPDCALFAELGYRLVHVTPVDMFPHTPHIEAVGLLERIETP